MSVIAVPLIRNVAGCSLVLAMSAMFLPRTAFPIVMRDDVAEQRFLELAQRYPAAVSLRTADRWHAEGIAPGDLVVAGGK